MASKPYNGHKNWNHWNVALWIGNDEGLYQLAKEALSACDTKREAAEYFMEALQEYRLDHTPDGAKFTKTTVLAALRGL